jgi:hypothetical protein
VFGVVSFDFSVEDASLFALVGLEGLEFHLIFGQGASLVCEDSVNLA